MSNFVFCKLLAFALPPRLLFHQIYLLSVYWAPLNCMAPDTQTAQTTVDMDIKLNNQRYPPAAHAHTGYLTVIDSGHSCVIMPRGVATWGIR